MGRMGYSSILIFMVFGLLGSAYAQLKMGFYAQSCPKAEKIIQDYVLKRAPVVAAPLLRMHFHDCFVRARFSGIISLATRDSVVAIGGPTWKVPTGRRDGRISVRSEALRNIPNPNSNFATLRSNFANKGLNVKDLVLLSGAHTIGVSHCNPSFSNRLYNFTGRGDQDPSLDSKYAANLKARKCRIITDNTTISEMDPGSFKTFDLGYYKNLVKRRGLFQSDAALITDAASKSFVTQLLQGGLSNFFAEFTTFMEKMGQLGVMTGSTREIRKKCSIIN
ncbi:hypothetical protein C5167_008782 [Papaver somniferum]|uniref:L-ascorbate peroxidase n=1 Tax=Papaver somniferum TaxID=3469 RepID=A0A4Y7JZF6_PAPSO|nr:hypothetical protein C5167_008782 [Papaver somniferum]